MSDEKYVYIQNTHNAPITCNARDKDRNVIFTKKFMPAITEKFSGKVLHSGYEKLTEEEYKAFVDTSRTYQIYSGKTGKNAFLVAHDELPADAKTPHEALVDARKEAKKAALKIKGLEDEIVALKAQLLDEQNKYKELFSVSTDAEKLKPLNERIAELEKQLTEFEEGKRIPEDKTAELTARLEGIVAANNDLVAGLLKSKDKIVKEAVEVYSKKLAELEGLKDS